MTLLPWMRDSMTKSQDTFSIALTRAQIEYLREAMEHEMSFDMKYVRKSARAVLDALDHPMPVYEAEAT